MDGNICNLSIRRPVSTVGDGTPFISPASIFIITRAAAGL
jgi:hypothetical protein